MVFPAIERFYEAFSAHGLLDSARVRFMPSGRFADVSGTFRSRPLDGFGGLTEDAAPSFRCPASAVSGIKQGDQLQVRGVDYTVSSVGAPNDRGEVALKLQIA